MKLDNVKKAKEEIEGIVFTEEDRERILKFSNQCDSQEIKEALMKFT